jgi:hypothetical protein
MKIATYLLALSLIISVVGCEHAPVPPTPSIVPPRPNPYQRFIPMPRQPENLGGVPWSGAFALDTKTGQICFTYPGEFDAKR